MRLGEILGLKWSDINFATGEISIHRSLQRIPIYEGDKIVRYEVVELTPKTENSTRTIPLPKGLIAKLKLHKKQQNALILRMGEDFNNRNYVFCNPLGDPIEDKRPGRHLKKILTELGIKPIKFHALRHTYATRLFEAGVPPKTVQKLMGHADIETTMNIYTHVMGEQKTDAVDKIDSFFI